MNRIINVFKYVNDRSNGTLKGVSLAVAWWIFSSVVYFNTDFVMRMSALKDITFSSVMSASIPIGHFFLLVIDIGLNGIVYSVFLFCAALGGLVIYAAFKWIKSIVRLFGEGIQREYNIERSEPTSKSRISFR